jgi:hypothetical protein
MRTITTFDSTKESLLDLLSSIGNGKTQLPDFQRGWIWDDEHIRSLLASISLSYPIGAVMTLETGNADVRFRPRLVEGVVLETIPEPERFILDGQQRLTSLFLALSSGRPVATRDSRGKAIKRWYYIDMEKALNPSMDREEDAIVALPEDKVVRNFRAEILQDYSTADHEFRAGMFPVSQLLDCSNWRTEHNTHWDYDRDKVKLFDSFDKEIIARFEQYHVPVIVLRKETPKEAVCQVFEKVNTGGVSLTVFELLTATFAADDFNLRDDWQEREKRLRKIEVLKGVQSTDFLQAVTLLATRSRRKQAIDSGTNESDAPGISCKRKDVLRLSLSEYRTLADPVIEGFERAGKLLFGQSIFTSRDLPYQTQLTPLASVMTLLGNKAENDGIRARLVRWYWSGVFGELYGGATESRFARDLPEVLSWSDGGPEPSTISDANFAPARLQTLRTRNSAAYKGLHTLLLRDGGQDFRSGESINQQVYFDERIDVHHIFPQRWCRTNAVDAGRCDSIVNKASISARTNRMIGGNAPGDYLERMQRSAGITAARMDEILTSHVIDPTALRANDFDGFFNARAEALLERIEQAMGKPIAREAIEPDVEGAVEFEDEEEEAA